MANSWTPSPATAPIEAPEIKSIGELQTKKADVLGYLQDMAELTAEDKAKFSAEFEKDMAALDSKTAEEKIKDIGSIKAEIDKLKAGIQSEKRDTNEDKDEILGTDETTVTAEQKLHVEKEIRGRLDEFRTSIENKLTPTEPAPTGTPEAAEEAVPEVLLPEPTISEDLVPPNRDYVSKKPGTVLDNFILKFFGHIPWVKKWRLGFKTEKEMTYTESSMSNILAVRWAPVNALINFNDLSIRDFRDILGQFGRLDFEVKENVEAAFLGKHADNPKYKKYHRIYNGTGDLADKVTRNWDAYDPVERLTKLLENSEKSEFDPDYTSEEAAPTRNDAPVLATTEEAAQTPEEAEAEMLRTASKMDDRVTEAEKKLKEAEAIPDNPWAIAEAETELESARKEVKKNIEDVKLTLDERISEVKEVQKDTTDIQIPMAERKLAEAQVALQANPEDETLKSNVAKAQKELNSMKTVVQNLTLALGKIQEKRELFDTPIGVPNLLTAVHIFSEAASELRKAQLAVEADIQREEEKTGNNVELTEILSRYDGIPYEEQWEQPSGDTIFTFEQDDIFLSIKRWGKKETISMNPNGTLTYRDITGTPEMIVQLARLDMYADSLPGELKLSADEDAIKKNYDGFGDPNNKEPNKFSMSTMPEFLAGWDWQQLYNFLLRDGERQIAPVEAAKMSGEKPNSITQKDLDILMDRTDSREKKEDAQFSWKLEGDGSVTITRSTLDGDKSWNESIFPNSDGSYTIGNVRFPNITDAVKAANMRNWVRWHEGKGNELHIEENNIQVDDSTERLISTKSIMPWERVRNDTNLIKDGKIPEFLTHGTLPRTEKALTNLDDVYSFLKGAVIDDGIYGKNKSRKLWEESKATPNQV